MYALLAMFSYLSTKFLGLENTISLFERLGRAFRRQHAKDSASPEALYASVMKGYVWVPFAIRCLDQAIITWFVLNINGYPASLKIGVTLSPLTSHAWVELGDKIFVDSNWIPDMVILADYPAWLRPVAVA